MLLTKQEVNNRIVRLEFWLKNNSEEHYLYKCIQKELEGYEEAQLELTIRNSNELNVSVKTEFYNSLNSL